MTNQIFPMLAGFGVLFVTACLAKSPPVPDTVPDAVAMKPSLSQETERDTPTEKKQKSSVAASSDSDSEPAVPKKVCAQPAENEPYPTISELRNRPLKQVSTSIQSKTVVLDHCNGYCLPVLEVPIVENTSIRQVLDDTWRKIVYLDDEEAVECDVFQMDFTVHFDDHDILSITFFVENDGGAYPVRITKDVNLTTKAAKLSSTSIFKTTAIPQIVAVVDKRMQKAIVDNSISLGKNRKEFEDFMKYRYPSGIHFLPQHLEQFFVAKDGLVFQFDFGLPHAIQALTPSDRYLIQYKALAPYLNPNGPFAWAIHSNSR